MNSRMIILLLILLFIGIAIGVIGFVVDKNDKDGDNCKTSYPEKPKVPPKRTPLSELIPLLRHDNIIDQIILAIALIEQPDGGYNYNYWGVHTDLGRWPHSDEIEYRVCLKEGLTGRKREYAGWSSPDKAIQWMRKIIKRKYQNFMQKYQSWNFAKFYAEQWKGTGEYKDWWNQKFAQAGQLLGGRA